MQHRCSAPGEMDDCDGHFRTRGFRDRRQCQRHGAPAARFTLERTTAISALHTFMTADPDHLWVELDCTMVQKGTGADIS